MAVPVLGQEYGRKMARRSRRRGWNCLVTDVLGRVEHGLNPAVRFKADHWTYAGADLDGNPCDRRYYGVGLPK